MKMLMRLLNPAGFFFLLSVNLAAAIDYFQLRAAAGGCIGRRTSRDDLVLKSCNFNDPNVMWRWDEFNRLHSKADDSQCIQAGEVPQILGGVAALDRGTDMFIKHCNNGAARIQFQSFSDDWEFAGLTGEMYLAARPDLCMTHQGADPVIGQSSIILIPCNELGGDRGEGWTAVFPPPPPQDNFFTLEAFGGGCIARRTGNRDDLFLKACSSQDATIQWRLDNNGRFRSKVNENFCMQAEEFPTILQGPSVLEQGSPMYVKSCGGALKDQFQVINTAIPMPLTVEYPQGPLTLVSRPDLCIVHFGSDPVIGQSKIMLAECDSLGGDRARGWLAVPPCNHPPFCPGFCTLDVFVCPDGTTVGRDPSNNCNFYPCPACTLDVFICPDGTAVGRDPSDNCAFFPCPTACALDVLICPDGTELVRQPPACEFPPCPGICTQDVRECPDGTFVGRNPNNNCRFFPCPPVACALDVFTCPDGTQLVRQPPNCVFPPCPAVCNQDVLVCPDGTELARRPPNCEFPPCPTICPLDVRECPDGSFVGRNPNNNCRFFACPAVSCPLDVFVCPDGTQLVRRPPLCLFPPCPVACTQDILICPDGTELARQPPECEFPRCPTFCAQDVKTCPGGETVSRNPFNNCQFFPCPTPTVCRTDVFFCPDGTTVSRVLPDCDFKPCPPMA